MCLTEYNEAETMQMFKEEGREEGELNIVAAVMDIRNGMPAEELEKKYSPETIERAKMIA